MILRLFEVVAPVHQVEEGEAHGEHDPGEDVDLLGPEPPGGEPHAEPVAQPGGGGGRQEAHKLDTLLASLHSPQERLLQVQELQLLVVPVQGQELQLLLPPSLLLRLSLGIKPVSGGCERPDTVLESTWRRS